MSKLNSALREVKRQMKKLKNPDSLTKPRKTDDFSVEAYEIEHDPFKGTGKILVSGTTVHGIDTKFTEEVSQNDFLIIRNSTEEKRKVALVLSDKSILICAAFPDEAATEFYIQKASIKVDPRAEIEETLKKRKIEEGEKVYEVRVKRGPWTYKNDVVKRKEKLSQEELLNIRAQRVRDKFCWM